MAIAEQQESEDQKRYREMRPIWDALKITIHLDCENGHQFSFDADPNSPSNEVNATRMAYDLGWREVGGKIYCKTCIEKL